MTLASSVCKVMRHDLDNLQIIDNLLDNQLTWSESEIKAVDAHHIDINSYSAVCCGWCLVWY